jgi:acyl dehydratase
VAVARYLEDFAPGQTFGSGVVRVDADAVRRFAAEFDPQPFHLDDDAARASLFRGLAASGWHTAALTMRLLVESEFRPVGGLVGVGFEGRWPRAVRPGDELHLVTTVLDVQPSKSNAGRGSVVVEVTTLNQRDEAVQASRFTVLVPKRPRVD